MNDATLVVAVANVALVVITAVYVVLVGKTLGETKRMARAADTSAKAARQQAEIMKDQFEVGYTPHLRPYVAYVHSGGQSVVIALSNWSGIAAIHPGVYPEWSEPSKSADYGVLSNSIGAALPIVKCATGQVIEVGETWYCHVFVPPEDSGRVDVRYDERPRKTDFWTLRSLPDMQDAWHFVAEPEEST